MKKGILAAVVSLLVLITTALWLFRAEFNLDNSDVFQLCGIVILAGFGILVAVRRIRSVSKGQPAEDEMSKKMVQKAAAYAYYISLYLWLVILYIGTEKDVDFETLTGSGILGMAVLFLLSWLFVRLKGMRNE